MRTKVISLIVVFSFLVVGALAGFAQPVEADTFRVGIVYSEGGLGDLSFNDLAQAGLMRAVDELGIEYGAIEPDSPADFNPALRRFAERGFDMVIAVGFLQAEEVIEIAPEYPNVQFAHIDQAHEDLDNVTGLIFAEHEGSFLVGALAALVSETGTVGFVGGIDSPLINRFEGGFVQGARYIDEDIQIESAYADSFNDPSRGREIALSHMDNGADVIYHAAGATGTGVFEAVEEEDQLAIGVDTNQNHLYPGHIIASMLKVVDVAVFTAIEDAMAGELPLGENVVYGLADGGTGITSLTDVDEERLAYEEGLIDEDELEKIRELKDRVTAPHAERIEEIKQMIIDGEIEIDDWSETGRQL